MHPTLIRHYFLPTRLLLLCGAIGCPLFILGFLIEEAIHPDYDPFRYPISSLSIGAYGWMQILNFVLTGLLFIAFAIGMRRTIRHSQGGAWAPLLIGLVGIGMIGAGVFVTDPIYGYPPHTPLLLAQHTTQGYLHNFFAMFVFAGLPFACLVFCFRFAALGSYGWVIYSAFSGLGMWVTFVLAGMGFGQLPWYVDFAGLFQRMAVLIGWTWITLLALHLLKDSNKDSIHATHPF